MLDLHIHTSNSDGKFDTISILKKAEELKLNYISITDHNMITAYEQLNNIDIKKYYSGRIITGTELEFAYDGIVMDMLGYNIDINNIKNSKPIQKFLKEDSIQIEKERLEKSLKICDKLKIKYSKNISINEKNDMANDVLIGDIIKYEENRSILNELKIPTDEKVYRTVFYRQHYCNPKSPFYIDKTINAMNIYDVVNAIHNSGGIAILAHIFVYQFENVENKLKSILDLNLIDGIECGHRKHSEEQLKYLENFAKNNKLLKTAGSDFHREKDCLGHINYGSIEINENMISKEILENNTNGLF